METLTARVEKGEKHDLLLIEGNITRKLVDFLKKTEIQSGLPYTFCASGIDDEKVMRKGNIRYLLDGANPAKIITELNQLLKDRSYQITLTSQVF